MWPFKKKEPFRVVSMMDKSGNILFDVQCYWGFEGMYTRVERFKTKDEACKHIQALQRQEEYGIKVEDCNCEGNK